MDSRIHIQSLQTLPKPIRKNGTRHLGQNDFKQLLQTQFHKSSELKMSKHAQQRMDLRGIEISAEKWMTIQEKVSEAKQKGIKDSVVITKDAALIVNAQNDTVITVLNREEAQSQIFTNINGTILID